MKQTQISYADKIRVIFVITSRFRLFLNSFSIFQNSWIAFFFFAYAFSLNIFFN